MHFGPFTQMVRADLRTPAAGAQWTGITTRLAKRLLQAGAGDAAPTMAPDPEDRWKSMPVIVTRVEDMAACRGMRMGHAPLLVPRAPAHAAGHRHHRHSVPGLRPARAGGGAGLRAAFRHRHAPLGQRRHREIP
jgi:coenzyme F420-reducing hydrogenase beta subunit